MELVSKKMEYVIVSVKTYSENQSTFQIENERIIKGITYRLNWYTLKISII